MKETVKTMVQLYARQMQLEMAGRESSAKLLLDVMRDGDLGDKRLAKRAADYEVAKIKKHKRQDSKFLVTTGMDTVMKAGQSQRQQCITCKKEYENESMEELRCENNIADRKERARACERLFLQGGPTLETAGRHQPDSDLSGSGQLQSAAEVQSSPLQRSCSVETGVAPPAVLCHKEPARASKAPY